MREERERFALRHLLRHIAINDVSFNAAQSSALKLSYMCLDRNFCIPNKDTLRTKMIDLAHEIKEETLKEIAGQKVSLMIDGSSRWEVHYIAAVIFTVKRLYLYSVVAITDQTSITLANVIASIVTELNDNNTTVISVNTDNAANNIRALNGDENSAQELSNSHFIRQPCAAHTLNLVICDAFKNKNAPLHEIYADAATLIKHAPRGENRVGSHPKFISIRWQSFYECFKFIKDNKFGYLESENEDICNLYSKHPWETILNILDILQKFLKSIANDLSTIVDIISAYYIAEKNLVLLQHPIANTVLEKLRTRFMSTCKLLLPWAAFLCTHDGLVYYRNKVIEQPTLFNDIKNALSI